jgi:Protein of unknown function (DUF2865)
MITRGKRAVIGIFSLGLLTLALATPASAQGIFERIFGGIRHTVEAPRAPVDAYADPSGNFGGDNAERRADGPSRAFCVRTGDGFYFPVQSRPGLNAVQACSAFCPGSKTALYSGSAIDNAVTSDGSRYADLGNAFLYRKQLVAGITCNGRDAFGLVRIDINSDPTLRPGDMVATKSGLMAFTGTTNKVATFAPAPPPRGNDRRRAQLDR